MIKIGRGKLSLSFSPSLSLFIARGVGGELRAPPTADIIYCTERSVKGERTHKSPWHIHAIKKKNIVCVFVHHSALLIDLLLSLTIKSRKNRKIKR